MVDLRRLDPDLATPEEGRVLSLHLGRSANCSSVGSVIDVLFVSTVVGSALLAAAAVLLARGPGVEKREPEPGEPEPGEPEPGVGKPEAGAGEAGTGASPVGEEER